MHIIRVSLYHFTRLSEPRGGVLFARQWQYLYFSVILKPRVMVQLWNLALLSQVLY